MLSAVYIIYLIF